MRTSTASAPRHSAVTSTTVKPATSGGRKKYGTGAAAPQPVSALAPDTSAYPAGHVQTKQGKEIEMSVTATDAPQGANEPVSVTSTNLGWYEQEDQGEGTT